MSFEITIPRLGWSMEEGTFVRWLKKEGDFVKSGEAVFELEGEKAAQDIEAVDSGILRIPPNAPPPGTVVAVGTVIGYLLAEGEAMPAAASGNAGTAAAARPTSSAPEPEVETSHLAPAASPSVRRLAREMGVKLTSLAGSGPAGRITAEDVRITTDKARRNDVAAQSSVASPRARRAASERGIDWRRIQGTGRDGRVRERDVLQAASHPQTDIGESVAIPVSSRRRTIANRMKASRDHTAPVTLTTKVDATNLVSLRNQFKQSGSSGIVPSYSDIVMKLVTLALEQHSQLAVREEGDQWVRPASLRGIHIGLAVDTGEGLVVPVIRGAGALGLFEIAKQSTALIEKSRSGKLSVTEMQGAVFTITNLGAFGIDAFTPIINLPETAVLGLGRIRKEPAVVDDRIVARDRIMLSLTFDHRIVDGAPAARFLQTVSQAIENPSAWLLRGEGENRTFRNPV
jgi:pyruvate dehydrogenase E2 component (dihydrolipoamide acetyltransferase)